MGIIIVLIIVVIALFVALSYNSLVKEKNRIELAEQELMKYDLSHNGIQDGIAQELQPFVVDGSSPVALGRHGSMHQGLLIVLYVVRIESQNVIKRAIKPFFLSER